jgi:hypothetical protein
MAYQDFLYCTKIAIGLLEKKSLHLSLIFGNTSFFLLNHLITTGDVDQFQKEQKIMLLITTHQSIFYWIQLLEKNKSRTLCWHGKHILETIAIPDEGFRVPVFLEIQQLSCLAYATSANAEKLNYLLQIIDLVQHLTSPDAIMLCRTAFLTIAESDPSNSIPKYKGVYIPQILRLLQLIEPYIGSCNSSEAKGLYILLRIMLYHGNPEVTTNTYDISLVFSCLNNPNMDPWGYWVTGYALCVSLALNRREFLQRNNLVSQWWEYYNLWFPFLKVPVEQEIMNTGGFIEDNYFS